MGPGWVSNLQLCFAGPRCFAPHASVRFWKGAAWCGVRCSCSLRMRPDAGLVQVRGVRCRAAQRDSIACCKVGCIRTGLSVARALLHDTCVPSMFMFSESSGVRRCGGQLPFLSSGVVGHAGVGANFRFRVPVFLDKPGWVPTSVSESTGVFGQAGVGDKLPFWSRPVS
jgi:hypothetical protein